MGAVLGEEGGSRVADSSCAACGVEILVRCVILCVVVRCREGEYLPVMITTLSFSLGNRVSSIWKVAIVSV
jgi:hypothetical protein